MTSPKDEFDHLEKQMDALQSTKDVVDRIIAYKKKLDEMAKGNLDDNQKLWLLAYEATEKRMSSNLENQKEQFIEDLFLLLKFIPDNG
jgi:hypothetical protein